MLLALNFIPIVFLIHFCKFNEVINLIGLYLTYAELYSDLLLQTDLVV